MANYIMQEIFSEKRQVLALTNTTRINLSLSWPYFHSSWLNKAHATEYIASREWNFCTVVLWYLINHFKGFHKDKRIWTFKREMIVYSSVSYILGRGSRWLEPEAYNIKQRCKPSFKSDNKTFKICSRPGNDSLKNRKQSKENWRNRIASHERWL